MDNKKYNRLTWMRKQRIGNHHPRYKKDIRRKMYENGYWEKDDLMDCFITSEKGIASTKNRQKEAIAIMEAINLFRYGRYAERKEYMEDLYEDGASFNGYTFQKEAWVWLVWKPTDDEKEPQFKGEHLVKVIPFNTPIENIPDVLNAQPWTYI